jgi:hypothetical protein
MMCDDIIIIIIIIIKSRFKGDRSLYALVGTSYLSYVVVVDIDLFYECYRNGEIQ